MAEETLQSVLKDAIDGKFDKPAEGSESTLTGLLARIPCTKDGVPILWADYVYMADPDKSPWCIDDVIGYPVEAITIGCNFDEYDGTHTILAGEWEGGNLECYSAKELVPLEC